MKRFVCLFLLLAVTSPAHASGIALRWGSCEGTSNRNFACDRSSGSELLVASFQPPSGIEQLTGVEAILRITSASGTVPSWWQMFANGSCRRTGGAISFDVSDQLDCENAWTIPATGGLGKWEVDGTGVNVWLVGAVTPAEAQRVSSGTKYAAFKIMINHQKSNGPGSCSGCETPMCIKLEAITLCNLGRVVDENSNKMESLTWEVTQGISGMGGASQIATWQGGTPNCAAGMAKPSTWSELKARFRSK